MDYRILGKTGMWVSRICFGTMTFAGKGLWEPIGKVTLEEAEPILREAFDSGVNFIDTADVYGEGDSERVLGQAVRNLGLPRQELVIATKVRGRTGKGMNQVGLSRSHIMYAVDDSLRRLQMDHIDLYYIHGFDMHTPFEETMRGLEDVVRSGKVRYLGCSNLAAWQIMKCNCIAGSHGWAKFDALQHFYSIACRDIEREILPMAQSEELAMMPWSPLAGGFLTGKFTRENMKGESGSRRHSFDFPPIDKERAFVIMDAMAEIGKAHNAGIAQIALSWLLHRKAVTSVIIGAKNVDQVKENIRVVDIKLTDDEMESLDQVSGRPIEYPQWMVERQNAMHARKSG